MRIAYIVSRFPHASETFIARELLALGASGEDELDLLSLFPAVDATVHPSAEPFVERLVRPRPRDALLAFGWWALRRPLRLGASVGVIVRDHLRNPAVLARALATVPLAAAHARLMLGRRVDHVHAHYATYPALAAWLCRRLTGTPYSFTVHAHDIFVDQGMLARKLSDAAFVVAISEHNRRFLSRYGDTSKVHVIHAGIPVATVPFRPRAVPAEGPVSALCVASLQEYKGHSVLLDALAGAPELQRVEVDLVGGGPLRSELERRADALGLGARVHFHGSMREDAVRDLLERADLFVLPSIVARDGQMEGVPVVLMEALAAGVPIVATRLSGIPELVRDGETGLLVTPGDVAALREGLVRMVSGGFEPDLQTGRETVEREFDVADSAAQLRELIATAVQGRIEQTSSRFAATP